MEKASKNVILESSAMNIKYKNTNIIKYNNISILNADVLNENLFDKEFIDLIITSPPYNVRKMAQAMII